jgi:hypothetical protein
MTQFLHLGALSFFAARWTNRSSYLCHKRAIRFAPICALASFLAAFVKVLPCGLGSWRMPDLKASWFGIAFRLQAYS